MGQLIYKYQLDLKEEQEIYVPIGSSFLTVQLQNGIPCLWAKVSEYAAKVSETILIVGTGFTVPPVTEYLGTFQLEEKGLVFHVFRQ